MSFEWRSAMMGAISEVLETMFFSLVDFEDQSASTAQYEFESGICLYNEAQRIDIGFLVTSSFARMVTANLLGMGEEDVSPEDIEDTMKELANMVGGNYQARISGGDWQLGIPSFKPLAGGAESGAADGLRFSSFGDPVGLVTLRLGTPGE